MITHIAPRRIAVTTSNDKHSSGFPIDLDTVLAVDMVACPSGGITLSIRLASGERVFTGTFTTMSEAGRDCGRLRVLAGLPVWPNLAAQTSCSFPEDTSSLSAKSVVWNSHHTVVGMVLASVAGTIGLWSSGLWHINPVGLRLLIGH